LQKHTLYAGVATIPASYELFQRIYSEKQIPIEEIDYDSDLYNNQYIILKDELSNSALARLKGKDIHLLNQKNIDKSTAIKPRNKEQIFALDALMDDSVKVVTLTGASGGGKTLCTLAAALKKIEQGVYDKMIMTKPSSQVGRRDLGILPGTLEEKFMPFLINYMCNLELITGQSQSISSKLGIEFFFEKNNIEIIPMQLLRGASFNNSIILADEVQTLNYHEMLTLGTRISEGSKLVLMGDLNQRDENIEKHATGLFKFINDEKVKNSSIASTVHMIKSERGEVCALFSDVFEDG
jgi:PhoH-like ATPase